jgi:hypothetical protein
MLCLGEQSGSRPIGGKRDQSEFGRLDRRHPLLMPVCRVGLLERS